MTASQLTPIRDPLRLPLKSNLNMAQISAPQSLMFQEAGEAHVCVETFLKRNEAVLKRIALRLIANPPKSVTTCARGSSDHAATYAKYLIEARLGIPTSSAALSVSSIFGTPILGASSLCIAISQSGRSPDLLSSVEAYAKSGAFVIALVNDETSPLADLADEVLPLCAGPELSVAATKSYITSLGGLVALVAHWSNDEDLIAKLNLLPAALKASFELDWSPALNDLITASNLFIIGRGYSYAIAQEAALKLKETCALHAEAFSSAEVRHGPMAIVKADFPIIGFATSDISGQDVRDVADEFVTRQSKVWIADALPMQSAHYNRLNMLKILNKDDNIPELEPILMIQSFYRLVAQLSVARGLNPDKPPHLSKITSTV